jgi:hemerythrin-like domain-containing protein
MKSPALLLDDHKHIVRAINILEQMAVIAGKGGSLDEGDVEYILEFLRSFADRHHQGKEEGVFFPALLQDRAQKNYHELCGLIFEHNQERSLVEGLEDAIRTKKTKDFVFCADRLIKNVRAHLQKEDEVLFLLADSTLSPSDDERVAGDMKNYERQWQETVLAGLLRRLDEVEVKYLGKTRVGTAFNK